MALCPICEHPLPETSPGRCPNCGADVVDVGAPGSDAPPPLTPLLVPALPPGSSAGGEGTPWDDRERLGFLAALIETTRQVLTAPTAFFRAMPVASGIGSPLLYGVILGWLGAIATGLYQALFHSIVGTSPFEALARLIDPNAVPSASPLSGFLEGWAGFLGQVFFGGVLAAVGILIYAAVLHLALLLLGGAARGFEATLRVVSFSQAVCVVFLLPFCGQLVGAVWAFVLYVIGIAQAQRIGYGKAIAGVLLPLVVLCCCCGAFFLVIFIGAAGLASQLR
jgi:hypothetical protein